MNERYLYRGKRKDNGEWIEGVPYFENNQCFMITDLFICEEYQCTGAENVEVIPETVGQCTGLKDKNSKRIFEGDIVKHYNHNPIKEYSEDIGRVFWFNPTQRYLKTSSLFPDEFHELFEEINCYEVIGNIHDNPELLEGI